MKPALAVLCLAALAGCAAGSAPGACDGVSWYQQGYMDGRRTWYSRLDEHKARCPGADSTQYTRGYEQGKFDQDHKSSGP